MRNHCKLGIVVFRNAGNREINPHEIEVLFPTNEENIDKSVAYMKSHLAERLTISKLASLARMSKSHFFVLFKDRTGKAPIEYFINLRMKHAAYLLRQTDLKVQYIAASVGYDDQFYFCRLFKLAYNVAPSLYRYLNTRAFIDHVS